MSTHPALESVLGAGETVGTKKIELVQPLGASSLVGELSQGLYVGGGMEQRAGRLTADPELGEQAEKQGHAVLGVGGGRVHRQAAGLQQAPDADDDHQLPQHAQ